MGGIVPRLNLRRTTRRFSRVAFAGLLAVAWFAPSALAETLTWQVVQGQVSVTESVIQFSYMNGMVEATVLTPEGATVVFSVTVDNTETNTIGYQGETSDRWAVTLIGDETATVADDLVAVSFVELSVMSSGTVTVQMSGIDVGYWAGYYGPRMSGWSLTVEEPATTTTSTTTTSEATTTTSEASTTTIVETTTSTELETTTTSSEPESSTTITEPASTTTLVEETWPPTTESTVPTTTVTTTVPTPIVPVIPPTTPSTVSTTSSTQPATTSQPPETSAPSSVVSSTEPESDPTTVETDPPLETTQAPAEAPLESVAPVVPFVPTVSNDAPTAPPPTETSSTTTTTTVTSTSLTPTAPPNNASDDDKQAFEETVNVFDGSFDDYIPAGSNVTVAQRRTIVAVTAAVSFLAPVATQRRRG